MSTTKRPARNVTAEDLKLERWAKVVNEMCTCGHLQTAHAGAIHHGLCLTPGCRCQKYTWDYFVDGDGTALR